MSTRRHLSYHKWSKRHKILKCCGLQLLEQLQIRHAERKQTEPDRRIANAADHVGTGVFHTTKRQLPHGGRTENGELSDRSHQWLLCPVRRSVQPSNRHRDRSQYCSAHAVDHLTRRPRGVRSDGGSRRAAVFRRLPSYGDASRVRSVRSADAVLPEFLAVLRRFLPDAERDQLGEIRGAASAPPLQRTRHFAPDHRGYRGDLYRECVADLSGMAGAGAQLLQLRPNCAVVELSTLVLRSSCGCFPDHAKTPEAHQRHFEVTPHLAELETPSPPGQVSGQRRLHRRDLLRFQPARYGSSDLRSLEKRTHVVRYHQLDRDHRVPEFVHQPRHLLLEKQRHPPWGFPDFAEPLPVLCPTLLPVCGSVSQWRRETQTKQLRGDSSSPGKRRPTSTVTVVRERARGEYSIAVGKNV